MLDREAMLFWISAQRLRLKPGVVPMEELAEALDDLVAIATNTDNQTLAHRCHEMLIEKAFPCASSA